MRKSWACLLVFTAQAAAAAPLQSQAQYEAAIANESTSPSYVLVTIVDDRTGESRTGCTEANFVQGALRVEEQLPVAMASFAKVHQQMLDAKDHTFHFSDPAAFDNVRFHYTPDQLEQARLYVQTHKDSIAAHDRKDVPGQLVWSDAFACALIEQGYSVSSDDNTGMMRWQ